MKLQHFVMKEGAYGELAFLKPAPQTSEKAVSSKRLPARQPAAPPKDDARERALEEQRLALEQHLRLCGDRHGGIALSAGARRDGVASASLVALPEEALEPSEDAGDLLDGAEPPRRAVRAASRSEPIISPAPRNPSRQPPVVGREPKLKTCKLSATKLCARIGRTCSSLLPVRHQPVSQKCEGKMFHDCPQNC